VSASSILGGERDTAITVDQNGFNFQTVDATNTLSCATGVSAATCSFNMAYDGVDSPTSLNPTGLNGYDLTAGGTANVICVNGWTTMNSYGTDITITIYTGNSNTYSMATQYYTTPIYCTHIGEGRTPTRWSHQIIAFAPVCAVNRGRVILCRP